MPLDLQRCRIATIQASGATFTGNRSFTGATFTGNAWFDGAKFTGNAWFDGAKFTGTAEFDSAGAEPNASGCRSNEEPLHLSDPAG
jgi:hypothetical protein